MARVQDEAVRREAGASGTVADGGARPTESGASTDRQRASTDRQRASTDRQGLIDLLNEDLRTEYQSIVQYVQHVATLKGAEFLATIAELKAHLTQELQHALVLAAQVDFLGGTPSVSVPDVATETDTFAALRLDLDLETRQLARYRERVRQAGEIGLPDVAEALRPLLEQTQEHVRDLQTALGT
jgi:bacterioferritin